ncbi:phosphatidate cytidylyltransferase [Sanguibacter sp. A247]|uniref:phosphatidate cytidylyltransferase n=1 Tax=unclassified Sanguibacter TaxID=2645534 RepID=UPI003FD82AB0
MPDVHEGAQPTTTGRSGRDLPRAIAVGLGLLAVVGLSLFLWTPAFVGLALVAVGAALWELAQAFARRDVHLPLAPLWVGSAGILVSAYSAGSEAMFVSFVLTVLGVLVWRALDGYGPRGLRDAAAATFATAYLPLMAGFAMLMLAQPEGVWRVLLFILLPVASDTGGFFAGVRFGKHPLAPSISPKKSWEGLAGSFVLTSIVGVVGIILLGGPWWWGLVLGAATPVTGTFGDLAESLLKRDLGLKDMGSLLPGHGGVLDRLDSLLLTAPFAYLMLSAALGG